MTLVAAEDRVIDPDTIRTSTLMLSVVTFTPEARTLNVSIATAAVDRADRAARELPRLGKAIRIVVRPSDAGVTRALLQRYGGEFKELQKPERTIFLLENRKGLSWEDHPFVINLAHELREQITPISFSVP